MNQENRGGGEERTGMERQHLGPKTETGRSRSLVNPHPGGRKTHQKDLDYLPFPLCLENLSAVKLLLCARAFNDRRRIARLGYRDASPL